jgi:hypothetical protein
MNVDAYSRGSGGQREKESRTCILMKGSYAAYINCRMTACGRAGWSLGLLHFFGRVSFQ